MACVVGNIDLASLEIFSIAGTAAEPRPPRGCTRPVQLHDRVKNLGSYRHLAFIRRANSCCPLKAGSAAPTPTASPPSSEDESASEMASRRDTPYWCARDYRGDPLPLFPSDPRLYPSEGRLVTATDRALVTKVGIHEATPRSRGGPPAATWRVAPVFCEDLVLDRAEEYPRVARAQDIGHTTIIAFALVLDPRRRLESWLGDCEGGP